MVAHVHRDALERRLPGLGGGEATANSAFQTARVSPNGQYLAFMSEQSLTGYDNEDLSSGHPGERMDEEVYLYDAHAASLTCVSCDPTGARPRGCSTQEGRRRYRSAR